MKSTILMAALLASAAFAHAQAQPQAPTPPPAPTPAPVPQTQEQGPLQISGSLFNEHSGIGVIGNRNALRKGDLLTIVVNEQSAGSTSSSLTATKQDANTVSPINIPLVSSILRALPGSAQNGATTGATSSVAGAGAANTTTSFTSSVTVTVKEVLPNGILVIEGKRSIKMNKQNQTILLEGMVRPDDVLADNTVVSSKVSDLRLVADGKGVIADRQREGILTRLLSWVF